MWLSKIVMINHRHRHRNHGHDPPHLNLRASNCVSLVKVVVSAKCASAWLSCHAFSLEVWDIKNFFSLIQIWKAVQGFFTQPPEKQNNQRFCFPTCNTHMEPLQRPSPPSPTRKPSLSFHFSDLFLSHQKMAKSSITNQSCHLQKIKYGIIEALSDGHYQFTSRINFSSTRRWSLSFHFSD